MTTVSGVDDLQTQIENLTANLQSGRLLRPALAQGARIIASGIREAAPVGRSAKIHRQNRKRAAAGGKAGLPKLRDNIGSRVRLTGRSDRRGAKAGASVGRKKNRRVPQGGWIAAGTKKRYRKDGSYAGQITRLNDYAERGTAAVQSRALDAIQDKLDLDIQASLH